MRSTGDARRQHPSRRDCPRALCRLRSDVERRRDRPARSGLHRCRCICGAEGDGIPGGASSLAKGPFRPPGSVRRMCSGRSSPISSRDMKAGRARSVRFSTWMTRSVSATPQRRWYMRNSYVHWVLPNGGCPPAPDLVQGGPCNAAVGAVTPEGLVGFIQQRFVHNAPFLQGYGVDPNDVPAVRSFVESLDIRVVQADLSVPPHSAKPRGRGSKARARCRAACRRWRRATFTSSATRPQVRANSERPILSSGSSTRITVRAPFDRTPRRLASRTTRRRNWTLSARTSPTGRT